MAYNFAKATVIETAEGDKAANVSCINGVTATSGTEYLLSSSATYYDGATINIDDEILFPIYDATNTPDESFIFPYSEDNGNPARLGGGIGKGNIIEEDEASGPNPTDAGVEVIWINGMNADGVIGNVADEAALSMDIDTVVYFLMTYDEFDVPEVLSVTASEGICGDVPAGEAQFHFEGANVPAGS